MGYGILFIACILLMNIVNYAYTDLICALLLTLAFVRLSPLQREYRAAAAVSLGMAVLGVAELVASVLTLLQISTEAWIPFFAMARAPLLGTVTVLMLLGIRQTAREVGLGRLAVRCESTLIIPIVLYSATFVLEIPGLLASVDPYGVSIVGAIVLLLTFVMHVVNAVTVYKAYARITMPGDADMEVRPSRFAFINRMRAVSEAREAQRRAEAQALFDAHMQKKKNKKKKKK